jgi:hypothetical protein
LGEGYRTWSSTLWSFLQSPVISCCNINTTTFALKQVRLGIASITCEGDIKTHLKGLGLEVVEWIDLTHSTVKPA